MWFGIAPAPAPSPRTNTKAWHPPHCTCARHGGAFISSSGRGETHSPRALRVVPRRTLPLSVSELSTERKTETQSPRERSTPTKKTSNAAKLDGLRTSRQQQKLSVVDTLRSMADDATQRVHRLSRRLSRRLSVQGDSTDTTTRKNEDHNQPEREEPHETDNRDVTVANWPLSDWNRPPSRGVTPTVLSRPTSSVKTALRPLDTPDRPASPFSFLSIPAPTVSQWSSRGSQLRSGEQYTRPATNGPLRFKPPHAVAVEDVIQLSPPTAERTHPANLVGHMSSVGVVLIDDEHFIVSCSIDGSVKVWSRRTFDCLYTLYGHDDAVTSVDLSPRWLVSGSHDTTLRVYESGHGFRFMHTLEGHSGHVTRVVLRGDHDTQHLAISCSDDASLRLWDVEHGYCVAVFVTHTSRVTCLLVIDAVLCSGSADASVCFWDLTPTTTNPTRRAVPPQFQALKSFRIHKATVQCLLSGSTAQDPTTCPSRKNLNEFVYSCSNDGTIQWFETQTLQHLGCVDSVQSPVYSMTVHPTLGFLVCSTGDGRLLVYSNLHCAKSPIAKRELKVAPKWISSLQLLPGRLLACVSEDYVYIVNLERPRIERVLATAHGFLNCVRWLKPEKLVTSGEDNVIKVWSIT